MSAEPLSLEEEIEVRLRCSVVKDPAGIFDAERRLLATLDRERVDSLDAAWAEAEAALPEGWWIDNVSLSGFTATIDGGPGSMNYSYWTAEAKGPKYASISGSDAPTTAAALRALTAKLKAADAIGGALG